MRTTRGLFAKLTTLEHLARATAHTVRGKRRRPDAAWFLFRREAELVRLRDALAAGTWRPGGFRVRLIRDPKPRPIACAPFDDRVVHAALVLLAEPTFLRSAIDTTFACRAGGGTHRAILALQRGMRRHRMVVHLDIRAYFASVHLGRLRALLARRIRDPRFLEVFNQVLDAGAAVYRDPGVCRRARLPYPHPPDRGLPIGALTSQLCAGFVYLDGLDHFVKRSIGVPIYARYMDDLFIFGDRRAALRDWRDAIGAWLHEERGLRLKHPRARLLSCAGHLDALGYRIRRQQLDVLPRTHRRLKGRLRDAWVEGTPPEGVAEATRAVAAWSLLG